ncbi:serine hydrolase FSH [Halenospora varia]|nr:serine hydrolase FSH [Halenospora varia]
MLPRNDLTISKAAIRYELGSSHTYEFVEGAVPYPMAPGISQIAAADTETFTWSDETSVQSCSEALRDLETFVDDSGPFDGLLAFSAGAALAATLLIHRSNMQPGRQQINQTFKCAISFSGGIPGDPVSILERKELRQLDPKIDAGKIQIPTAHIWGSNDFLYPTFGPVLRDLCLKDTREEYVHQKGHAIPGSQDKTDMEKTVRIIRRTIERALTMH